MRSWVTAKNVSANKRISPIVNAVANVLRGCCGSPPPISTFPPEMSSMSPGTRIRTSPEAESARSEEHTSELQSLAYLVCRLLLEKKKKKKIIDNVYTYKITKCIE